VDVQDVTLLDRLALQMLEAVAQGVKAEGCKWVEARLFFG
jgi:hypothetical protein